MSGGIYVDGPAWISRAGVHIQRENEMFFGSAAIWRGKRIKKQRARSEVDDGRAGNPNRIDVTAPEVA